MPLRPLVRHPTKAEIRRLALTLWVRRWLGRLWTFLNKPLGIAVLTLGVFQCIAYFAVSREHYLKDRADRANLLGPLLVEISQRADELLIVDKGWTNDNRSISKIAQPETDIILGSGSYVATAPQFQKVHLINLMHQTDYNANTFDRKLDYLSTFSFFAPKNGLVSPYMVYTSIPTLQKYAMGRSILLQSDEIPLQIGQPLNKFQQAFYMIPFCVGQT